MHSTSSSRAWCHDVLASCFVLALQGGVMGGCSESTAPSTDPSLNLLDPAASTFALRDISVRGPAGDPVLLRLEGSDLVADPETGTVSIAVAVRNLSNESLLPPLVIWVTDLRPNDIWPLNADYTRPLPDAPVDSSGAVAESVEFGFDYSAVMGEPGPLGPGQATGPRTWTFSDPSLAPFSFAAHAQCGPFAGQSRLGGWCFVDLDGNGEPGRGELPFPACVIQVAGPDGFAMRTIPGPDGWYAVGIDEPGLYKVTFHALPLSPLPVELTTPNPLNVIITRAPDGTLSDFDRAHFGVAPRRSIDLQPIRFTGTSPDSLHQAPWTLVEAHTDGRALSMRVGFHGCRADDFQLWMSGGFLDAVPPSVNLTLVHAPLDGCGDYMERDLHFDLETLFDLYLGEFEPGPLVLGLHGPDGFRYHLTVTVILARCG